MTWQTRTICTFVAATVPVEAAGDVNPLLEQAQQIGIETKPESDKPVADGSVKEPQTGSYERFMSSFGSPSRWAGR